jgi:hypothetical protein
MIESVGYWCFSRKAEGTSQKDIVMLILAWGCFNVAIGKYSTVVWQGVIPATCQRELQLEIWFDFIDVLI